MKILADKGETNEPNFLNDYMTAAGMLKSMQGYLAAGLAGNHPDVMGQLTFAQAPSSSSSSQQSLGSSASRSKSRAAPKGSSKGIEMDQAPDQKEAVLLAELRSVTVDNSEVGKLLHLQFRDDVSATPAKQVTILTHLLGELEFRVRSETFRVVNDDGTPIIGYPTGDENAEGEEILDGLTALPLVALSQFASINTGDASELPPSDKRDATTMLMRSGLPRMIAMQIKPGVWGDIGFGKALAQLLTSPAPTNQGLLLWVPDHLPWLFYDPVNSDTLYRPTQQGRFQPLSYGLTYSQEVLATLKVNGRKVKPNDAAVITGARYPFYTLFNNGIWTAVMSKPKQNWPKEGVGGQGAMRCDGAAEFKASALDFAGILGRALGLPYDFALASIHTQTTDYPRFVVNGIKEGRLWYEKEYQANVKKRNLPALTRPLSFFAPEANPFQSADEARKQVKAVMKVSGFTMKRKGDRSGDTTEGLSVGKPVASRAAANLVMRDALKERFGNAVGTQSMAQWQGSATQLVAMAFGQDPVASAFWAEQSKELVTPDGKAATKEQKSVLRAAQEWCHLFGHGDGGEEVPDNFVSGSKHCNSEQLALELTQRLYRDDPNGVTVRITAYLMPSGLPVQATNWGVLKALPGFEQAFSQIVAEKPATISARADRDARLKKLLGEYCTAYGKNKNMVARTASTSIGPIKLPGNKEASAQSYNAAAAAAEFAAQAAAALFPLMPIAYLMRYKVYVGANEIKCIDHVYSGQREEMDYNEFQALQWSFRLKIAEAIDGPQDDGVQGPEHAAVTELLDQKIAALGAG